MEEQLYGVISGKSVLARDVFNNTGLLLLKTGTVITRRYKELLKAHMIKTIWVL